VRIATRLLVALVAAVTGIMVVYAWIALHQRAEMVSEAMGRETDTLASALKAVTDNALRDGRYQDLEGVLRGVAEDPETFLVAVLAPDGSIVSGGPSTLPRCLAFVDPGDPGPDGRRGWAECGGRVRWVVLSVREPAGSLVVARRATVVDRDVAASRIRILLTTLALAGGAAVVILLVLRMTLSRPLEEIMRGVRTLGGPSLPDRIELPANAGELRDLAEAFNEMAARLEGKRNFLIEEVEERLALERRLQTEEKFAALGRLTGGIAHELGTPLNVIGVRAETIETMPGVTDPGKREAALIINEVERIADLIRSLTHIARGDQLHRVRVELRGLLSEIVAEVERASLGRNAPDRGAVAIRLELGEEPVFVEGDLNLLRHALRNLVLNAVHASSGVGNPGETKGVNHGGWVTVRLSLQEDQARVEIEDEGPGISDVVLGRLFEPFFTTKEVGEGTGLGLAMTRGILQEHDGSITVEQRSPSGLGVICLLPLAAES
jgi:signal transduction histidine kinase